MRAPSLLDACHAAGVPSPVSHEDLVQCFAALARAGVRHNLEGEPIHRTCMAEAEARGIPTRPGVVQ